jgi:hypothetical protein
MPRHRSEHPSAWQAVPSPAGWRICTFAPGCPATFTSRWAISGWRDPGAALPYGPGPTGAASMEAPYTSRRSLPLAMSQAANAEVMVGLSSDLGSFPNPESTLAWGGGVGGHGKVGRRFSAGIKLHHWRLKDALFEELFDQPVHVTSAQLGLSVVVFWRAERDGKLSCLAGPPSIAADANVEGTEHEATAEPQGVPADPPGDVARGDAREGLRARLATRASLNLFGGGATLLPEIRQAPGCRRPGERSNGVHRRAELLHSRQ